MERIITWRWADIPIEREKEESEGEDDVMKGEDACVTVNMVCVWYEECVSGSMYDYMVC